MWDKSTANPTMLRANHAGFSVSEMSRCCLRLFSNRPDERETKDEWFLASDPAAAGIEAGRMLTRLTDKQRWRDKQLPTQARLQSHDGTVLALYRREKDGFRSVRLGEDDELSP